LPNIQDLLNMLHITIIHEKIDKPHFMIRENYVLPKYVASSYNDCCNIITKYYQYHYSAWMKFSTPMPKDIAFAQVKTILDKGQGGFVTSVKNALWGRDAALVGLLDAIADSLREDATEKYVEYILSKVSPLDYDLKVQFMRQYIKQYATPVLPNEKLMSPYELAANFGGVIKYHLQWINSLRKNIQ
jgi:hypothetical protein